MAVPLTPQRRALLEARLADCEAALQKLLTGTLSVTLKDGAGQEETMQPVDIAVLERRLEALQVQLGQGSGRGLRIGFGR